MQRRDSPLILESNRGRSRRALSAGTALTGALFAFVASSPADAAAANWTDATGDWQNGANWSAGFPSPATDATVSNGGTAQINGPATAQTLTIGGNSTVDLQTGQLLVGGPITLNPTGTLSVSGSTTLGATAILLSGGTLRANTSTSLGPPFTNVIVFTGINTTSTVSAAAGQTLTLAPGLLQLDPNTNVRIGSATDTGTVVFAEGGPPNIVGPGTNTYEVVGGTWKAGNAIAITQLTSVTGSTTTVDLGATLDMNGFATAINNLHGNGTVATNGGTLTLTQSGVPPSTFGGAITGGGALVVGGGAQITLTGTNSYTGGTTISGATVRLGNGGTTGSIVGNVTDNGQLAFDRSDTYVFAGNVSGTGSIEQFGTGTTILTGTNAYGGGTGIFAGTLQIGNGGTAGSITGNVSDDGTLAFNHSDNITFSGLISGTGAVQQNGSGTLMLSGANTYSGGTTINAGTLAITSDGNLGAVTGALTFNGGTLQVLTAGSSITLSPTRTVTLGAAGGTIDVEGTDGFQINQSIGGAGGLTVTGNQSVVLAGNNTYGGPTTIFSALVAFGGNAIPDTSTVTVNAGGTLVYSGTETIGALAGGGQVHGGNAGVNTLTTGANNASTTFTGTLIDFGAAKLALTKIGNGTQTLSSTNSYSGDTNVNGGTLSVNGSIVSSHVFVNSGGTLGGTGTVGATTISNGGTLSPGNSIGTLTVQGNLVMASAAVYLVEVSASSADFTTITGTATLGGTVQTVFASGSSFLKNYDILHANGGLGGTTFSGVNGINSNFGVSLSYTTTDVFLNLTAVLGTGTTLNQNQRNVATSINNFFNGGGALPAGFANLFGLTGGSLATALTQLSGETATGSQQATFDAMNLFMGVLTDPSINGRGYVASAGGTANGFTDEALAYTVSGKRRPTGERDAYAAMARKAPPLAPTFEQRWSTWAAGYGGSRKVDGDPIIGSNRTTDDVYGGAVGADYRFSPETLAGFALGGAGTRFSVDNLGSGRSDMFQAGAFLRHNIGPAYITGALAYGRQDVTTDRTVTIAGVDQLRARFSANALSGRAEAGYRFVVPVLGGFGLTPYAAGQFTTFWLPAYAEQAVTGANTFALAYGAKTVTDGRSELGFRSDKSYALQGAILTFRGREAWLHDYTPDRTIGASFLTLPGAAFTVTGARQPRDALLSTTSAEIKWMNGWSIEGLFESEYARHLSSYAGKGVVRYQW